MIKQLVLPGLACLALVACNEITDPVGKRGLRVENRTVDTLVVNVFSRTTTANISIAPIDNATPRTVTDSSAFTPFSTRRGDVGARLIAPGAAYVFSATEIGNFDRSVPLIAFIFRVRRGYQFDSNGLEFTPEQIRASGARLTLRSGQYFPTVLP
jgi:hypothetical protein